MEIDRLLSKICLHGRTFYDEELKTLFFNWTCSGFTVKFNGSYLKARLSAFCDHMPSLPGAPEPSTDWPCLGVTGDNEETLIFRAELKDNDSVINVFDGSKGEHTVRFIKLSENRRGKLGILELETDGEFLPMPPCKKPLLEVIGDSITCGFGNEAPDNSPLFVTPEENGWLSYGAIAARKLGYEISMVCESGICVSQPEKPLFPLHGMDEVYDYTDELLASRCGRTPELWDFRKHPAKVILINLGTNDANPVRYCSGSVEAESIMSLFCQKYKQFLENVRKRNGRETFLLCALGSMDYYFYNSICKTVEEFITDTGDVRTFVFAFNPMNSEIDGTGAAGHPSAKTHRKMAAELEYYIRKYVE